MKTLYLIRHGKSSWENMSFQDYERPLLEKGKKRTRKIAGFLSEKKAVPDLIISSHAERAYDTAIIIAKKLGYEKDKIIIDQNLYFCGSQAMENILFGIDDQVNDVMLVGHNPDMTNFANIFLEQKIDYLPTSGVVCVRFHTNRWTDIFSVKREIPYVVRPSEID